MSLWSFRVAGLCDAGATPDVLPASCLFQAWSCRPCRRPCLARSGRFRRSSMNRRLRHPRVGRRNRQSWLAESPVSHVVPSGARIPESRATHIPKVLAFLLHGEQTFDACACFFSRTTSRTFAGRAWRAIQGAASILSRTIESGCSPGSVVVRFGLHHNYVIRWVRPLGQCRCRLEFGPAIEVCSVSVCKPGRKRLRVQSGPAVAVWILPISIRPIPSRGVPCSDSVSTGHRLRWTPMVPGVMSPAMVCRTPSSLSGASRVSRGKGIAGAQFGLSYEGPDCNDNCQGT